LNLIGWEVFSISGTEGFQGSPYVLYVQCYVYCTFLKWQKIISVLEEHPILFFSVKVTEKLATTLVMVSAWVYAIWEHHMPMAVTLVLVWFGWATIWDHYLLCCSFFHNSWLSKIWYYFSSPFGPEEGGNKFLWNVGSFYHFNCMISRRLLQWICWMQFLNPTANIHHI